LIFGGAVQPARSGASFGIALRGPDTFVLRPPEPAICFIRRELHLFVGLLGVLKTVGDGRVGAACSEA